MAVSPTPDESYYWEIALAYRDAELDILEQIKNRLLKGQTLDDQAWATARLAEVQTMRKQTTATLRAVNNSSASKITGSLGNAYKDGEINALKDTKAYLPGKPQAITSQARLGAVSSVAREIAEGVAEAQSGVLRQAVDSYQQVVRNVVLATATGATDRRTATARALKDAYGAGLKTGPGGKMNLESYIQMATRTGVAKAMVQGSLDAMAANGLDLVYVHPGPRACEVCDIWGNTVLWREGGPTGVVIVGSMVDDSIVEVKVSGALPQARSAGWGHPNCRCSVGAYIPGATEMPKNRPPWDEEGYEAQQKQRGIERKIREAKRDLALSTDPTSVQKAAARVQLWQAAQREHMDANPFLKRQYGREGGAVTPGSTPTPTSKPTSKTPKSTWVGKPKPVAPSVPEAPKGQKEKALDEWEAAVAARFKAFAKKTGNPKTDITQSHAYSWVEKAKKGYPGMANKLLADEYIDMELYEALQKAYDAPVIMSGDDIRAYAKAYDRYTAEVKKHEADMAAWRRANNIKTRPPVDWSNVVKHNDNYEGTAWANNTLPVAVEGTVQYKAAKRYTSGQYKAWNEELRNAHDTGAGINELWATPTKQLDSALKPAPVNVLVKRGTTGEELNGGKPLTSQDILDLVGTTYAQHGYTSTSVGHTAAFGGRQVELEILVPKGYPVAWVDPYSEHKGERELVLARSTQYFIHDVYELGGERVRVVVEAVPDGVDTSIWEPSPPARY